MLRNILFLTFFAVAFAGDVLYEKCGGNLACLEGSLVDFVDGYDREDISLFGGMVSLGKKGEEFAASRGGEGLMERCARFLANREITFKLSKEVSEGLIEESRSSKLKKILLPILLLLKLKGAIVVTIVLSIIALISFKGLGASLIALAISGATGFKSLLENHASGASSKVSYEILPSISSGHWNRLGADSLTQAYAAPYPQQ